MIEYATTSDLTAWLTAQQQTTFAAAISDAGGQLLRSATLLIAKATGNNPYIQTLPVPDPLRDATCAQAAAWVTGKVSPVAGVGGLEAAAKSKKIGTATISYAVGSLADQQTAISALATDAYNVLYDAGVLVQLLPVWGDFDPTDDPLITAWPWSGAPSTYTGYWPY